MPPGEEASRLGRRRERFLPARVSEKNKSFSRRKGTLTLFRTLAEGNWSDKSTKTSPGPRVSSLCSSLPPPDRARQRRNFGFAVAGANVMSLFY